MGMYSKRFPFWTYERDPGLEYVIEPSRKLFGKQRYGLAKSKPRPGVVDRRHDYQTREEAEPWLNSLNLYAKLWVIFEAGEHDRIARMVAWIGGEDPEDLKGYGERAIFGDLAHGVPGKVAEALKRFSE